MSLKGPPQHPSLGVHGRAGQPDLANLSVTMLCGLCFESHRSCCTRSDSYSHRSHGRIYTRYKCPTVVVLVLEIVAPKCNSSSNSSGNMCSRSSRSCLVVIVIIIVLVLVLVLVLVIVVLVLVLIVVLVLVVVVVVVVVHVDVVLVLIIGSGVAVNC